MQAVSLFFLDHSHTLCLKTFKCLLLFNIKKIVQSICYKIAHSAVLLENLIQKL